MRYGGQTVITPSRGDHTFPTMVHRPGGFVCASSSQDTPWGSRNLACVGGKVSFEPWGRGVGSGKGALVTGQSKEATPNTSYDSLPAPQSGLEADFFQKQPPPPP